jgi:hypothetical protein
MREDSIMSFVAAKKVLTGSGPEALSATSIAISKATIQAKRGNTGKIEIAPSSSFSVGDGFELRAPAAGVALDAYEIIPQQGAQSTNLNHWYIRGTANDGVNIIYEVY